MQIGAWEWLAALFKLLTYAGTLAGAGTAFFLVYSAHGIPASTRNALQRSAGGLALLALLCTLIKIPLMAGAVEGDVRGMLDAGNVRMTLGGGEAMGTLLRLAGLLLMSAALLTARRSLPFAVLGALLAATSFGWTGHVHGRHDWLLSALLMLHLLCAAFWIGALWPLWKILHEDPILAATVVKRFSQIALAAVPALLLVGTILLSQMLGGIRQLWTSDYGRLMSAKLCLVAGLLALAAINKRVLTPRLVASGATTALSRSIALEMLLAAGVLAASAGFTTLTGPGD